MQSRACSDYAEVQPVLQELKKLKSGCFFSLAVPQAVGGLWVADKGQSSLHTLSLSK